MFGRRPEVGQTDSGTQFREKNLAPLIYQLINDFQRLPASGPAKVEKSWNSHDDGNTALNFLSLLLFSIGHSLRLSDRSRSFCLVPPIGSGSCHEATKHALSTKYMNIG